MTQPWPDILRSCGFPDDVLVLDFECFHDAKYRLPTLSTIEYIQDEQFEELGVAHLRIRGDRPDVHPVSGFDHNVGDLLDWAQTEYGQNLEGCTVVAQNALFDGAILAFRHKILPPHVVDILGLARHINPRQKNDLGTLAKRYNLKPKGDTKQFSGHHWSGQIGPPMQAVEPGKASVKRGTPVRWNSSKTHYQVVTRRGMDEAMRLALAAYARNDAEIEWDLFKLLLPTLSRPAFELWAMNHTLNLFWQPCIAVDYAEADTVVGEMKRVVVDVLKPTGRTQKEIGGNISFEALLQEALGDEPVPKKKGKKQEIMALAKADPQLEYLKKHPKPQVRELIAARIAVKSWPLHIARVNRIVRQTAAAGGLLPVPLKYMGAHTGRWSGGERINLQNLSARSEHEAINRIRNLLIAVPGQTLVIADAAQIEARVLAWLAGQDDLMLAFATGVAIYCQAASEITGFPIRKALADDPPTLVKWLKHYRQLGKVEVLGCGYGMGWKHLIVFAKAAYGIDVSEELARKIVGHYRQKNRAITKFWRDTENAFKLVTRYPHERRTLPRGLEFWREDDTTIIQLPCSRLLRYPQAQVVQEGDRSCIRWPDYRKPGVYVRAWGGVLVENIVQAASRDILAEAIMASEQNGAEMGLRVGHHCHDEIIGVVDEAHGKAASEIEIAALSRPLEWTGDCPLAAEGFLTKKYGK